MLAETITAISAAFIVLLNLIKIMPQGVKTFFLKTIPLFFKGTITAEKKRVRGFETLKVHKESQRQSQNIIAALASDLEFEEILILDKTELLKLLSEAKALRKETRRK